MTLGGIGSVPYKNNLRRLTLVIGAVLTFFGVLLLAVVAYAGWSANRTAIERERQLVENALDQAVSRVLNEEKAIAWWDDAVINAQRRPLDQEWIETNIGVYFYETYGHDEMYLVDGDNRPIYANIGGELQRHPAVAFSRRSNVLDQVVQGARGHRDGGLRIRDAAFTADQQRYSFLLGAESASWSGHILTVGGQPAVVSAMAIVPSVDADVLVETYALPTLLTNCSNNYGPYQFPEKLIPLMILNAAEGRPLPIYGDGGNVRDWLYVDDHCRGIRLVLEKGRPGAKYNLGGGNERTNLEVVDRLCEAMEKVRPAAENEALRARSLTSYSALKTFVKDRPGHDRRYAIDASRVRAELGWRPDHAFEAGLERTVRWYLENSWWCEAVQSGKYGRERLGSGDLRGERDSLPRSKGVQGGAPQRPLARKR